MAFNKNAVARKVIARGGGKALQRARRAVAESPSGALARRLGVAEDQPLPVTIDRKEAINRQGRKVKAPIAGNVVSDAIPSSNAAQRFARSRMPGSPF